MNVIDEIAAERQRQIEGEGWTFKHDDEHSRGEMALAAACYCQSAVGKKIEKSSMWHLWPWDLKFWKPKNPRRDLIRGAAGCRRRDQTAGSGGGDRGMSHVTHNQAFDALVNPDVPLEKAMKLFERAHRRSNDVTRYFVVVSGLNIRSLKQKKRKKNEK